MRAAITRAGELATISDCGTPTCFTLSCETSTTSVAAETFHGDDEIGSQA